MGILNLVFRKMRVTIRSDEEEGKPPVAQFLGDTLSGEFQIQLDLLRSLGLWIV